MIDQLISNERLKILLIFLVELILVNMSCQLDQQDNIHKWLYSEEGTT
jgi:hypothetical protein